MPKIDVLVKLQYLLALNELELVLQYIGRNLGPLQSLKFSSSNSLWKITYMACNKHQIPKQDRAPPKPCRATKDHAE